MPNKEIEEFLQSKTDLKDSSKTTYRNTYKKLVEIFKIDKRRYIRNIKIKDIIDVLEKTEYDKLSLLKVIIMLKQFKQKPIKRLNKYRDTLFKRNEKEKKAVLKTTLNDGLTFDDLNNMLNEMKQTNKYIEYILLYLLINFNVRNTDLIIINKVDMTLKELKQKFNLKEFNYIEKVKDGQYRYIRNIYKTKAQYGIKKHLINDEFFIEAMQNVNKDDYIFNDRNDKPIMKDTMNKFIYYKMKPFNKKIVNYTDINQQLIYKIILSRYEKLNDNNKVKELRANRGHTATIQESYYSKE